jgi:cyclophilin family peptidyl-prolyl cis-trans isomerase
VEVLESRRLMTASLAPIANLTVPEFQGYQLALDGSGSTSSSQSFTATSSNPDIKVSVAQGQFWTLRVSHTAANSTDVTINNESMTFQLFGDLTPQTVSRITTLTNENYYTTATLPNSNPNGPGKFFPRITSVASSGFSVLQGGSGSATSTSSSSGLTPIATEIAQQLAFTGQNQLAMANTGSPNSSDAQFFITNGTLSQSVQQSFDYNYSIFGQLVSGQQTVTDLSHVAVTTNASGENSQPLNPVTIDAATLSSNNANGVLHIDTSGATVGQTATITVTATDPIDHTTSTQSFVVTVGSYVGPTNSVTSTGALNTAQTVKLTNSAPGTIADFNISYRLLTQPAHGTISDFNSTTGTLTYTPDKDYTGPDTFQYQVLAQPTSSSSPTAISLGTAQLSVTAAATGAVHLIDNDVLVVTPLPRTDHGTDNIHITQVADSTVSGGQKIVVTVNGIPDQVEPPANSLLQIIVFGGKASTDTQVDPSVSSTIPITLDGGHGGHNVIQAGAGPTREHGWFGHTLLIGGTGSNYLVGRKGFVRFKPTKTTKQIYAGDINPRWKHRTVAPTGAFYRFVNGRLVPVLTT